MRLGLIARADNSGLGVQTWEFFRHMKPAKVLVIDVSHLHNDSTHTNKRTYLDRYPGALVHQGWTPDTATLEQFLDGVDVVFTCETTYSSELVPLANARGIKVVIQPNWEFLERGWPTPDLYAAPSLWMYDHLPVNKVHLPVPIATDRFAGKCQETAGRTHFLHIVGRPAHLDRNGTVELLKALQYVTAQVTVTVRSQTPGYVSGLVHEHNIRTPNNVTFVVDSGDVENYWDNYNTGDVLVMPRRFGGLCLPVNEALGAGMPVIMPDISPNNTWLPAEWLIPAHHQTSFRAKQNVSVYGVEPHDLAALMDQFATDPDLYVKAKDEALRLRDEYSWEALKPRYVEVLGNA